MIQLTDNEKKYYENQKKCYLCNQKFCYDKNQKSNFKLSKKLEIIVILQENLEELLIKYHMKFL